MGRYRHTTQKFYCPKCNKKTLVRDSQYDHSTQSWSRGWVCKNQPPKKYDRLVELLTNGDPHDELNDAETYVEYELRWGDDCEKLRLAKQEEIKAYLKRRPPCDCKIFVPGKDAEIVDYHTVLDLLIRPGEQIKHYLLEKDPNIRRQGFEVLYSSETIDLVRMRDGSGVAVWLYWKCTWEPDREKSEINWRALSHEAAAYISHKDVPLRAIFGNSRRYAVWTKPVREQERASCLRHVPFSGGLGKRKKAEIVEWAKVLEANLVSYQEKAVAAVDTWLAWGRQLNAAIGKSKVSIGHYNAHSKTASINIHGWLNQAQIEAIAEALGKTS